MLWPAPQKPYARWTALHRIVPFAQPPSLLPSGASGALHVAVQSALGAAPPQLRPSALCRPCARQQLNPMDRSSSGEQFSIRSVSPLKQPGLVSDGNHCRGCGSPFTFFRVRRVCGQCSANICAKCEIHPLEDSQAAGRCAGCVYGRAFQQRRVGVDWGAIGCLLCGAKFTLFSRRHWCRRCGRTICHSCSSTPLSITSRRNPNCICKLCRFPRIFRLSYDVAQYMMEFCDCFTRGLVMRVCKRFQKLLVLPYPTIDRITDWYELMDSENTILGRGAFGVVHRARCRRTGETRALKVIPKHRIASYATVQLVMREIDVHSHIDHPNSVRLFDVLQSRTDLFIVMGYAGKCNLADVLTNKGPLQDSLAAAFVHQLLCFLVYLHHEKFILHRDLKPQNIVLSLSDAGVRVVDFGLAKVIGPPTSVVVGVDGVSNAAVQSHIPCTPCGTFRYCAPEVIAPRAHLRKVRYPVAFKRDVFSVGVLAYTMLTGRPLYHSNSATDLLEEMRTGISFRLSTLSVEAADFIKAMCSFDPNRRMSAMEALQHPWLHCAISAPRVPLSVEFLCGHQSTLQPEAKEHSNTLTKTEMCSCQSEPKLVAEGSLDGQSAKWPISSDSFYL
eukprot:GGOE01002433.1.p1 GENE.GGOE01002433.1~~GGOE01002433.1.p1  ORF type:complete len:615 (+),score=38.79 GGOE01002433.1:624-2468(+)